MQPSTFAEHPAHILESRSFFESGGKKITVEIYTPAAQKKFAAILLLHGAGGIFMDGPAIRRFARTLAENGFETFVAHYLERTGNLYVRDVAIRNNFETWRETLNDAVNFVQARPEVSAIGLFGYSLGGFLSLAQAAHDPRIGAVVELAGAIPKDKIALVKRLPPILIMHGDRDRRVPAESAEVLEKIAARLGIPHEKKIYESEGHVLSTESQRDAANRAVKFFQKNLP